MPRKYQLSRLLSAESLHYRLHINSPTMLSQITVSLVLIKLLSYLASLMAKTRKISLLISLRQPQIRFCLQFYTNYTPRYQLVFMALFSAGSSHICHLAASVSNAKPTCPPGTHPPAVSPKALSLVHYSSSCTPLLSVPSFPFVP